MTLLLAMLLLADPPSGSAFVRQGMSRDGGVAWPVECVGLSAGASATTSDIRDAGHLHAQFGVGLASLASIDTKTPALVGGKVPVDAVCTVVGVATEATLALIKAKTDNLDVALSTRTKPADTQPVSLASVPTHGVTGTFWQATQPVSGTFWQATQPVSGTFWQATQPVSIASMPSTPVTGTFWQATQPVSVKGNAGANLDGPTGSAPPANALLQGLRETTNMVAQVQCDKTAMANIATATDTQLVAISGSTIIYVCSAYVEIQGVATTAGTMQLEYGTGSSCGTGKTAITPTFIGSTTAGNPTVVPMSAGAGYLFKTIAGQALCALTTTTTVQKVFVSYAQF